LKRGFNGEENYGTKEIIINLKNINIIISWGGVFFQSGGQVPLNQLGVSYPDPNGRNSAIT
jgi:hypothetical protein